MTGMPLDAFRRLNSRHVIRQHPPAIDEREEANRTNYHSKEIVGRHIALRSKRSTCRKLIIGSQAGNVKLEGMPRFSIKDLLIATTCIAMGIGLLAFPYYHHE